MERGLMRDFTTDGTAAWAEGKTGELAHKAADVNCVTSLALSPLLPGPEDVRKTFLSFDFRPVENSQNLGD